MPCWDHSASSWPASPDPAGLPSGPLLSPSSSKEVSVCPWHQGQLAIWRREVEVLLEMWVQGWAEQDYVCNSGLSWGVRNKIQALDKTDWRSKAARKQVHQLTKKDDFIGFGVWLTGGGVERGSIADEPPRMVVRKASQSEAGAGALLRWNWSGTVWKNPGSGLLVSLSYCRVFLGEKVSWLLSSKYSAEMFISVIMCWY